MRILFYLVLGSGIGFVFYLVAGRVPEEWYEISRNVVLIALLLCGGYVLYWLYKRRGNRDKGSY